MYMEAPKYDVLSYGTIGMDRIIRVPHLPDANRSTHSSYESLALGGKATNAASVLAHWGISVAVSGTTIGDDAMGNALFEALKQHPGISTEFLVRQPDLTSMFCYIFVARNGERVIVGMNADENPTTPPSVEMIRQCRILTLDLYGGAERVEAARIARTLAKPVIIGDLREGDHPILAYTDLAISSAAELRLHNINSGEFANQAMLSGAGGVIVTNGPRPVRVFDPDHSVTEITPPDIDVVNTTGAGDAFRAGVVYGVLANKTLVESAKLGTAVGALIAEASDATRRIPDFTTATNLASRLHDKRIHFSDLD